MQISNLKTKIVYSLRIHIQLYWLGFSPITEMKNPKNPNLNCWVYAATPDFLAAFNSLVGEVSANG